MILAHRIALDPTAKQSIALLRACGCARFTWNWLLAKVQERWNTNKKFPSIQQLKKEFNKIKITEFPWIYQSPKDANQQPFLNQNKAWTYYFRGKAKGKNVGKPRFKKRGQRDSFYVSNDRFCIQDRIVRLPVIGQVRLQEKLRFQGKITGAVISRTADRWFISVTVDTGNAKLTRKANGIIGVDLGIKTTITCSDGQIFESPKPLFRRLKRLIRRSKQQARKKKGSNNRRKAQRKLAKEQAHIANIRRDWTHKATTSLVRENQTICIEDLNVKGMTANKKLSRALSDVIFGEIRRQLTYKTIRYNGCLVVVNRFEPSSKRCSQCQSVKDKLLLDERIYCCQHCGLELDRDLNAAINIHTLGLREIYACGPEGSDVECKFDMKPRREEAGTKPRVGLFRLAN